MSSISSLICEARSQNLNRAPVFEDGPEAGPELDARVAAEVMGWVEPAVVYQWQDREKRGEPLIAFRHRPDPENAHDAESHLVTADGEEVIDGKPYRLYLPDGFSSETFCSYRVVDRLRRLGFHFELERGRASCIARFCRPEMAMAEGVAATVQLAICSAALAAMGLARAMGENLAEVRSGLAVS